MRSALSIVAENYSWL